MICPAIGRTKISYARAKIGWVFAKKREARRFILSQDNFALMNYIKFNR